MNTMKMFFFLSIPDRVIHISTVLEQNFLFSTIPNVVGIVQCENSSISEWSAVK